MMSDIIFTSVDGLTVTEVDGECLGCAVGGYAEGIQTTFGMSAESMGLSTLIMRISNEEA